MKFDMRRAEMLNEASEHSAMKFVTVTWNACGMEQGAILDTIAMLEGCRWDAILIQEGPASEKDGASIIRGGHSIFVSKSEGKKRTACILLHRRWAEAKYSFCAL